MVKRRIGGASINEGGLEWQDFRDVLDNLLVQQKEGYANSNNRVSTVSPSVSAVGQSFDNADDLLTDPLMPDLEDTADLLNTGIFSGAYDDEDRGNTQGSPKEEQIIGDINLATQTRRMTKISEEHALKVWTLVDLPNDKRAIGTKWVFRNKKDERGIIVRNKARLVAQGYTQEEGIDYDKREVYCANLLVLKSHKSLITFLLDDAQEIPDEFYGELTFFFRVVGTRRKMMESFIAKTSIGDILKLCDFVTVKSAALHRDLKRHAQG
ncbi:putative ribonuclease H-like domain-containing protein [Tanacetum coccineum]